MRRHAYADRVLTAREDVVHVGGTGQNHRERTGPEALGEPRGGLGDFAYPVMQEARAVQMDDDRMRRRPALGLKYLAHRGRVLRIRTETIVGLGGEGDELAVAQ